MNKTHGLSRHPLYMVWYHMNRRCTNPKYVQYHRYGGRGIKVCDRWANSIAAFVEDMGPTYKLGLTLDRINNDGNYELNNCRWATPKEQANNHKQHDRRGIKSPTAKLTNSHVRLIRWLKGQMTQAEIAELFSVNQSTIHLIQTRKSWTYV